MADTLSDKVGTCTPPCKWTEQGFHTAELAVTVWLLTTEEQSLTFPFLDTAYGLEGKEGPQDKPSSSRRN